MKEIFVASRLMSDAFRKTILIDHHVREERRVGKEAK